MRINQISGQTSRAGALTRLWNVYNNLWNRKEDQSESSSSVPAPPVENPKQAMHNPFRGSRSFALIFRMPLPKRSMQKDAGNVATDAHVDAPMPAAKQPKDQELIPPIPSNTHDDQPIQPEKIRSRLFADPSFDQQEPEATPSASDPVKLKRETNNIPESAEEAIQ